MSKKIKLVRVDQRLLHATVALNWNSYVNADYILIIDSYYKNDIFLEKVLRLSFSGKSQVKIFSTTQLISFLKEDNETSANIIIVFKDLPSLYECVNMGLLIKEVQIPYPASRFLLKSIDEYFTNSELEIIQKMQEKKIKFFFQTTPMDTKDYSIFKNMK